jgi:predicted Zn-dependent peptidase
MHQYFQSRYNSTNLFVAASGRIDFDDLVEQVSSCCGDWEPHPTSRKLAPVRAAASQPLVHCVHRPTATQQYLLQLADAPASEDESRYAAKLLSTMLGDDSGSRFYWELVDPGRVESASLGHYEYQAAGMYYTWVSCDPERAADNFAQLTQLQQQAETAGFTQEELRQAKNKVKARVVLGSERPRNRLFNVGGNWIQRHEYRSVRDDLRAIDAVSLDDIHAVLAQYPLSHCTTLTVGPLEDLQRQE